MNSHLNIYLCMFQTNRQLRHCLNSPRNTLDMERISLSKVPALSKVLIAIML